MLENFVLPQIRRNNLQNRWMQQDCATAHTARQSMDVLRREYPNRLISRFGDVNFSAFKCYVCFYYDNKIDEFTVVYFSLVFK